MGDLRKLAPRIAAGGLVAATLVVAVWPRPASAQTAPAQLAAIVGGDRLPECAWPSAAALRLGRRLCSGTLVHPQLVVFAAHCGLDVDQIYFGEDIADMALRPGEVPRGGRQVGVAGCHAYPGHNIFNGTDFAYCRLAEAVHDVPIVPVMMGCETAALQAGRAVTLVGFGRDGDEVLGRKRAVVARMRAPDGLKVLLGGDGLDSCYGDSGGPAFVKLDDGSWRLFALTSYGRVRACGPGGFYALVHRGVPWIEAHSGLDITPCHAADGAWAPGPECGQFPLQPQRGGGRWATGCGVGAPLSGWGQSCGAPHAEGDPQLHLLPIAGDGSAVQVRACDADGAPLSALVAQLDGAPLAAPAANRAPYYRLALPPLAVGGHVLSALGEDGRGRRITRTWALDSAEPAGAGGCQQAPLSALGWPGAAWLVGRRRLGGGLGRWLGLLLAVEVAGGCGPPPAVVTHQALPPPAMGRHQGAGERPAGAWLSDGDGRPSPFTFAYFAFGRPSPDGEPPPLFLFFVDRADSCQLLARAAARPHSHSVVLTLTNRLSPPADQPAHGHYRLEAGSTAPAGRALTGRRWQLGGACEDVVGEAASQAVAGAVDIDTVITPFGARVAGELHGLRFADGAGGHRGRFDAPICDLGGRQPGWTQFCLDPGAPSDHAGP